MNTTDPVGPQGLLDRQSQGKSTIRVAIFLIVSIHAVFFAGLLMQGCKRDETKIPLRTAESSASENPRLPDTNQIYTNPQEVPQETSITGASNTVSHTVSDAPAPLSAPTTLTAGETKNHTVVRGDTLFKIASANGLSVSAITTANANVDPAK